MFLDAFILNLVVECVPAEMIEQARSTMYLGALNDTRDLFGYLKQMRAFFVSYAKERV